MSQPPDDTRPYLSGKGWSAMAMSYAGFRFVWTG